MNDTTTRWGLFPWFEEQGRDLIHPDDVATVRTLLPAGKVFRVLGEEDGFVRLRYGETEFRGRLPLFREISAEIHEIGGAVRLEDGQIGEVLEVNWHHQRAEPMYQIRLGGKAKSKRYWNSDFASP